MPKTQSPSAQKPQSPFKILVKDRKFAMEKINYTLKAKHRICNSVVELSSEEVEALLTAALNRRLNDQRKFVTITGIDGISLALLLNTEGNKQRIRILGYGGDAFRLRFSSECLINKKNIGRPIKLIQCNCKQDCYVLDGTVEEVVSLKCNYKNSYDKKKSVK
jgi:hypothetical protein